MIAFAWILLLFASTVADLVDQVYQIPASDWRYVELDLKQKPAIVHAHYSVESGPKHVRLALMRREEMERLRSGQRPDTIEETESAASGHFLPRPRGPGDFVVVVINEADAPSSVRLRIWLDFAVATQLSARRQLVVILLSFGTFFGIVTWSARRLLRGIKR
jgi:hypothetical protein